MAYDRQFKHKKQWNNFDGGRKKSFKRRDDFPKPDGLQVFVKNNDVQKALRKLKRMVKDTNLMEDLKNKQYFRKPSEIKREKKKPKKDVMHKKQTKKETKN